MSEDLLCLVLFWLEHCLLHQIWMCMSLVRVFYWDFVWLEHCVLHQIWMGMYEFSQG